MRASSAEADAERWLAVGLRSLHLAGVVWLGAMVVAGAAVHDGAAWLVFGSGLVMLAMDLRAGRIALRELAGAVVLAKLALAGWMALDARQSSWIFWTLLVASSISSHAPKGFRHWPTRPQVRASKASNPG